MFSLSEAMIWMWTILAVCIATTSSSPVAANSPPDHPPLVWKFLYEALAEVLDPKDRGLPYDSACNAFCSLGEPAQKGIAVAACGAALLADAWSNLLCPLSMMSLFNSFLEPSECTKLCKSSQEAIKKLPRTAFDWTGVYVDPATAVVAGGGLAYLLGNGKKEKQSVQNTGATKKVKKKATTNKFNRRSKTWVTSDGSDNYVYNFECWPVDEDNCMHNCFGEKHLCPACTSEADAAAFTTAKGRHHYTFDQTVVTGGNVGFNRDARGLCEGEPATTYQCSYDNVVNKIWTCVLATTGTGTKCKTYHRVTDGHLEEKDCSFN